MKRVWLVSHYAMPPHLEVRIKTLRYAQILQNRGYEVLLITASTIHNTEINLIESAELYAEKEYENLKYVHIKCSSYKGSGLKRIKNMLQFQGRFKRVMKRFEKPDVIVADCNCVNYRGLLSFARKYRIPFITEVRDLWPLSIVEYKNISDSNPIIKYLYSQEKRMYRYSDAVIFSMEGGKDYIREKGWDKIIDLNKVFYINNGLDVAVQDQQREEFILEDPDLNGDTFKVIYAGSIRMVNSIDHIVQTAELLKDRKDIEFLLYGEGDKLAELKSYCAEHSIESVKFKGRVDKRYIPYICSKASINLISVKQTGVSKYGVSWNKLFDYMAAGRPILSTVEVNYDLIKHYNCGISLSEQTPQAISEGILKIYNMSEDEYNSLCINARNAAKDFDYSILTDKLEEAMRYAVENYRRK